MPTNRRRLAAIAVMLTVTPSNGMREFVGVTFRVADDLPLSDALAVAAARHGATPSYIAAPAPTARVGAYVITPALADPIGRLTDPTETPRIGKLTVTGAALTVPATDGRAEDRAGVPTFTGTAMSTMARDGIIASYAAATVPGLIGPEILAARSTNTAPASSLLGLEVVAASNGPAMAQSPIDRHEITASSAPTAPVPAGSDAIAASVADPSSTPVDGPAVPQDQVSVLDFEFVAGPQNGQPIGDYYNGGASGGVNAASRGPDYGITFSSNALGLCRGNVGGACSGNFAGAPSPNGVLFFLGGSSATMTVAAGFRTGFSFFYSAAFEPGFVRVFDDVNGTGNVLATIDLAVTPFTPGVGACAEYAAAIFCPFVPIGVTFSGTARSVDFGGTGNQIAFDNITFGSDVPVGVVTPEPGTTALLGIGLAGATLLRRRRRA
jgi:hypothetical protein